MALLEREGVLDALRACLPAARAGGALALVSGEAGAGKTSVVRALAGGVPAEVRVLWGGCDPLISPRPLGPVLDVAERTGGELAQVAGSGARAHLVHRALVAELGAVRPTLLVLEDVHWADEATLDVITLLGRRAEDAGALVVLTFREEGLPAAHPLRVVLGALATAPGVTRVPVPPLSPGAVARLAAGSGLRPDDLYRLTGGNPFFVTEVVAGGGTAVPASVRDAVLARAGGLGPQARAALDAAAIVPAAAEPWLLEALIGPSLAGLDECLSMGLLVPAGDRVAFRHELARRAVEEAVPPHRRQALHRAALEALSGRPEAADLTRMAHHAAAAGDAAAVRRLAPGAAEQAARLGAHREAARMYHLVLDRGGVGDPAERAALLAAAADEHYMVSEHEEAVAAIDAALAVHEGRGDRLRAGDMRRRRSRYLWVAGRSAEARDEARRSTEALEGLPAGREHAMALSNRSQLAMLEEDGVTAVEIGGRAIELAERLGDDGVLAHALTNVGSARFIQGDDAGLADLERALAVARDAGMEEHVARVHTNIGSIATRLHRHELALGHLDSGIAFTSERGLDGWVGYLLAWRGAVALAMGRWTEAERWAVRAREHPGAKDLDHIVALTTLGLVRARRGDDPAEALAEAWALAVPTQELQRLGPAAAARAEAALLRGDPQAAGRAVDDVWALVSERGDGWLLGELAWLRREAGGPGGVPARCAEPWALHLRGDDLGAAAAWRARGCPYEAARALIASGVPDAMAEGRAEAAGLGAAPLLALAGRGGPAPVGGLTAREREVLALLASGLSNREVAEALVISESTAARHVANILAKLRVHSRAAAAAEAVRRGIAAPR